MNSNLCSFLWKRTSKRHNTMAPRNAATIPTIVPVVTFFSMPEVPELLAPLLPLLESDAELSPDDG